MTAEVLDKLIICDAAGFLMTEGESEEDFFRRIDDTAAVYDNFEAELRGGKKVRVFDLFEVSSDCRISPELTEEAAEITENLYGFAVHHVPGFYLTRQIGLLWGGCLIGDPEQNFAVFLLRNAFRKKRRFQYDMPDAPPFESARTFFRKLDFVNGLSVIEAELFTGRMHQIRATLFSLDYPVAGDKLYGLDENFYLKQRSDELTESDREKLLLSRQALHSAYLEFTGISGEKLFFSSPMPDDMKKLTTEN